MKPVSSNKISINFFPTHSEVPARMSEISERTRNFVERMYDSTSNVISEFLETNTRQIKLRDPADKLYCYNNLLLMRTNGQKAYNLEQNIKQVEGLDIAPRFVQYFQLGKDDFLTVLEGGVEALLPYSENIQKISPNTKLAFKTKVKSLLEKGFNNSEIFANKDAYLVSPDGGKIIFADWGSMENVSHETKQALKNHLTNWQI